MLDPRTPILLSEFGITIVPATRYPSLRETRAPETVSRILRKRGEAHTRLMLSTLAETANNAVLLDESGFWACSDLVLAYADAIENDMDAWFSVWDRTPVGPLQWGVQRRLSGIVNQRAALAGQIHERLYERFDRDQSQPELPLEDRRVA